MSPSASRFSYVLTAAEVLALVSLAALFWQLRLTSKALPEVAKTTIHAELHETRALVSDKFDMLDRRVGSLASLIDNRLGRLEGDTVKQLDALRKDTFKELASIRGDGLKIANEQLAETNKQVGRLVTAYADIPKNVGERLDEFTDCKRNKLCLQGQASDTMQALRATSRDFSAMTFKINDAMPVFVGNSLAITANFKASTEVFTNGFPKVVTNIGGITANVEHFTHPHWYSTALGYVATGVGIYRQINPISNLTVKAAQVISEQAK